MKKRFFINGRLVGNETYDIVGALQQIIDDIMMGCNRGYTELGSWEFEEVEEPKPTDELSDYSQCDRF